MSRYPHFPSPPPHLIPRYPHFRKSVVYNCLSESVEQNFSNISFWVSVAIMTPVLPKYRVFQNYHTNCMPGDSSCCVEIIASFQMPKLFSSPKILPFNQFFLEFDHAQSTNFHEISLLHLSFNIWGYSTDLFGLGSTPSRRGCSCSSCILLLLWAYHLYSIKCDDSEIEPLSDCTDVIHSKRMNRR